jgi:hypothetical protein
MARVQPSDLIFMFATGGVGIIAVGRATGSRQGPFPVGDDRRIRGDNWRAAEMASTGEMASLGIGQSLSV